MTPGGESRIAKALSDVENQAIDTCTSCPKLCRWACPVAEAEARETSSPWGLVTLAGLAKRGIAPPESVGDAPYHCTHCQACVQACLHDNDVPLVITLARQRLFAARSVPPPVREIRDGFGAAGNPYGQSLREELQALADHAAFACDLSSATPSGSTLYFPGCSTVRDTPDVVSSALRAFLVMGLQDVVMSEASAACCGLPLLWAGDLDGFAAHANRHQERLAGASKVVVHDPACAHAMAHWYDRVGVPMAPEIIQLTDYLSDRLELGAEAGTIPEHTLRPQTAEDTEEERLAYADTCHLARGLSLVKTPRRLIEQATGRAPLELPADTGKEADCCGAGGLLPSTAPRTAEAMGMERLELFRQSGADSLVVCSPRCIAHLRRLDPSAKILDISGLLARLRA